MIELLNTLDLQFLGGEVLHDEELNQIVSHINNVVGHINSTIIPAIENIPKGSDGKDGKAGKDGLNGEEGISSLNAFVGATNTEEALLKLGDRNLQAYPPGLYSIGSNVLINNGEVLFMTSARRKGINNWLYGEDGYIWGVPVLLGTGNTTSTTGVDTDNLNYIYCRTLRNVDAASLYTSVASTQFLILDYIENHPGSGVKVNNNQLTYIADLDNNTNSNINGAWTDHPYGIDETFPHEWMVGYKKNEQDLWEYYFGPIMISNYGYNGLDGDGFEYIFKGFSSEQTFWDENSDWYPPKWIASVNSAVFLEDDFQGPVGYLWADDAIGVDDTNNKFVYVCSRKKYIDLGASRATWHTFSAPKLWAQYVPPGEQGPQGQNGAFTLFIFKNSSLDLSTSGNYNELSTSTSSIPTGWSLTATNPSSSEYIWGSHRLISFNTSNEEIYGSWQTPYKVSGKDGVSLSSYILMLETWCDAVSVGGIYTEPTPNSGWYDYTPTNSSNYKYLWRRSRKMVLNSAGTDYEAETLNGVLTDEGKWKYMKLSGTNGTSVNTKGTVATASDLNNISNPSDGDAYKCEADGCLYVWSSEANRWINLGQFKGELGNPGTTYYTHIAWAGDVTLGSTPSGHTTTGLTTSPNASSVTDFSVSPFSGATWMGTLINTVSSDSTDSLAYTWVYVKGQQGPAGNGCEYIYKGFPSQLTFGQNNNNPAYWAANQTDGYTGPNDYQWSSTMIATSSLNKFVYTSVRKKVNGSWQLFETPVLSSNFATAENATTTVVYQLVATVSEIRYKRNHAGVVVWMPSTFNLKLYKFQGTTFDNISLPSGYYVLRIIDGTNSASTSLGTVNVSDLASYTSNGNPVIGERVTIELRDSDDEVHAILNLSIVREFLRMLIPMGAYVSKRYDMTDTTVPLVLGSNGKYYYLDADTNEVSNTYVDPTTSGQTVWGEATEYEVILTKALFADFAKLGSFVVYDKYFFSLFGYLYNSDGSYSIINTSSAAPAAYANFDPNDPMVNTLPSSGHLKFRPAKIIDAETGEEWGANGNIHIGTDGSVRIKGDILATSLIAGSTSGLNITTTGTAINFNEGNDTKAYFTSELYGLLLYIKNPNDGVWYKIDFSKWYNTQQLNVTFNSHIFFTVNSTTNSINVADVISLTTLYYYNNEWYTTASTTGYLPRTDIKYYRRVPVSVFEDDTTKTANFPCLLHRGEFTVSYSDNSSSSTEICYYAMEHVYAFIETEYNSSTHKMTDTGYVFYVAYGGNSASGPTGGPVTYYYEYKTSYGVVSSRRANSSSSPLFLMFDTSYNNDACTYIYNGTLRTNTTYPYWTIYTPMELILYQNQIGNSSTINTIRTNLAPTLLEDDYDGYGSYNFMEAIDSDYSSNVSELN